MEKNIKERVSQYVDENKVKEKLTQFFQEKIVNRKAMFIPIAGVATFMLVGYAAADTEAPVIVSDQIEVTYGEKFDVDTLDITDNRDERSDIQVNADLASLNVQQLGDYKITVTATDSFNNETTKEVTVKVVDQEGPKFETLGSNEGYVVEVPVNGSSDLSSYVKATDNVDGDVTPFIEADKTLDTSKLGTQTITLKATDADKCMMVEAGENISFTLPQTIRPEDDKITFFMRVRKPLTKPVIQLTCDGKVIAKKKLQTANPPEMVALTAEWKEEYQGHIVMEGKEA